MSELIAGVAFPAEPTQFDKGLSNPLQDTLHARSLGATSGLVMSTNKKLFAEILHASRRMTVARDAMLAGFGMTTARVRLLKMVQRLPVPFTISELARAMDVSRQAVRLTVRELAAAGLVYVEVSNRHRRAPLILLSSAGRATLDQLQQAERSWLRDLTRGFDERTLAQTEWVVRVMRERSQD